MITQSESGLSAGSYNSVRDAANTQGQMPAFDVIAYRYNPYFGTTPNQSSTNTTDNDGTDWDVIIIGSNQYRAIGTGTIEVYNGSTLSTVSGFTAVTNVVAGSRLSLATDGTNLFVFSVASDGLYRRQYTIGTSTWGSWTLIIAMAGTTSQWSANLIDDSVAAASASSSSTGFSPAYALAGNTGGDWKSNVAGSGNWIVNLDSLAAFTIHQYTINFPPGSAAPSGAGWVTSYVFEGSNDNSAYTAIDTVTDLSTQAAGIYSATFTAKTYKYFRFRFTAFKDARTSVSQKPQISQVELYYNQAFDSQIIGFGAVSADRVHLLILDSSNQVYRVAAYQNNAGTWSAKTTGIQEIRHDYKLESIVALTFNSVDILIFQGYIAGRRVMKVDGDQAVPQVTQVQGILYATYEPTSQIYSHVTALDVIDAADTTNYRKYPRISVNNSKLYVTCYASDGSSTPVTGYRCYTGYEINALTAGDYQPLPSGYGLSGVEFIQNGSYVYAWQKDYMYRSSSTDYFGSTSSGNTDSTIKSRIGEYQFSMDQGFSGAFVLDNSDGYFDSHSWFNTDNTIRLVHKHGYNISGTDQLVQVAVTEVDSIEYVEQLGQRQLRVSFRDRIAWITDKIKSEEPNDTRGPVFGFDNFDATISSEHAGMGHLALQSGPWITSGATLRVKPVKNSDNIIFSTLLAQDQDNFYASFLMNDPNGTTTATYGSGLCFRARDSKNFLYLTFVGSTAKLNRCLEGVYSEISTATVTTFVTTEPIIVAVEGATVWVYHNGSSASFTLDSAKVSYYTPTLYSRYGNLSNIGMLVSSENAFGRGFIGFISRQSTGTSEVTFNNLRATGMLTRPLSYGDAFIKIAALANVKASMPYYDFLSGTWAGAANTRSGNQIQVTASGDAYRTDFTLPTNYVLKYKRTSGTAYGLKFLSATDSTYVEVGEYGITYYNGTTTTTLASVAYKNAGASSTDQDYYVGVQKKEQSGKTYVTICAWTNHLIGVVTFDTSAYTVDFNRIAFKGIATYNVYLHEIPNVIDGFTVDPGEPMGGAIGRLLEGREFRLYTRYDGSINLARKENQSSQFTFTYFEDYSVQFDKRGIRTHVRVLGASHKAEYIDTALLQKYGHLFEESDSPYMMTEEECLNQAKHIVRVMKSMAEQVKFRTSYNPVLEIGDHITVNDGVNNVGEYIITGISASLGPQWECEIVGRLFVAEA